jgi:SAM-dependent methyltransferase
MIVFVYVILLGLFVSICYLAFYIIFLFLNSRGFKISPTITSNSKSIKMMVAYINKYNNEVLKKNDLKILDIGSGYGRLLIKFNKLLNNPSNVFIGYEISKLSYNISKFLNNSKNIYLINDDINNLYDTDFDFIISFMLERQQKKLVDLYKKLNKDTIILANSNPIPFKTDDGFEIIDKINVHFGWDIFVYKKNK